MSKVHANKGVERNKKPLQNIVYKVEVSQLKPSIDESKIEEYSKYKFKDEGYLVLSWEYQKNYNKNNKSMKWHGFITPEDLKNLIGDKQWSKFCSGKREFIEQRRIDGKNVSKK
jgi:hypothetical protein